MTNLYQQIKNMFPELTEQDFCPGGIIALEDDGKAQYIAKWNHPTIPNPNIRLEKS